MMLPQLGGRELAARLSIHRPAIKVLYISGTSEAPSPASACSSRGRQFLEKPFSLDRPPAHVRQALGDPDGGNRPAWADRAPPPVSSCRRPLLEQAS